MRPFPINQFSPARPITATQRRSARWSAGTSKTLREAQKIPPSGALRLTQPDQPIIAVIGRQVEKQTLVFMNVNVLRGKRSEYASVRILATPSVDAQVRSNPARAEARAATEQSPAGSVAARWTPADGGRSEEAGPSFRACAGSSRPSTRAGRSSAARPAVVAVGCKTHVVCRWSLVGVGRSADAGQPRLIAAAACATCGIQTLPKRAKGTCVLLKENTTVFS